MIYQKDSSKAEEFIHHEEILDTLEYAKNNKDNRALIEQLIEKASHCKGLSHREAALLLECNQPDLIERIFHLAKEIKHWPERQFSDYIGYRQRRFRKIMVWRHRIPRGYYRIPCS